MGLELVHGRAEDLWSVAGKQRVHVDDVTTCQAALNDGADHEGQGEDPELRSDTGCVRLASFLRRLSQHQPVHDHVGGGNGDCGQSCPSENPTEGDIPVARCWRCMPSGLLEASGE
jgi:hypothetical protein